MIHFIRFDTTRGVERMVIDFGGKAMLEAGGQQQARRRVQYDENGCGYAVPAIVGNVVEAVYRLGVGE